MSNRLSKLMGYSSGKSRGITFLESTQWTVPQGVYSIIVTACGGGGGGGSSTYVSGNGGSARMIRVRMDVTPGDILDIVIGAGTTSRGGTTSVGMLDIFSGGYRGSAGGGSGGVGMVGANSGPGAGGVHYSAGQTDTSGEDGIVTIEWEE